MDVFGCKFQCALHLLIHLKIIDPHVMWHLLHLNHGQPWSTHEWIRELFIWCSTYHMIFMPSECVSLSDCLSAYLWLSIWKFSPQHAISNLKFKTRIISNKCIHYKTLSLFLMLRSGYPWGILICQLRLCCLMVHTIWATVREWLQCNRYMPSFNPIPRIKHICEHSYTIEYAPN